MDSINDQLNLAIYFDQSWMYNKVNRKWAFMFRSDIPSDIWFSARDRSFLMDSIYGLTWPIKVIRAHVRSLMNFPSMIGKGY